jgi:hypothetical protein
MSEETSDYKTEGPDSHSAVADAESWRAVFRRIEELVAEQEAHSPYRLACLSIYRKWPEADAEITGTLQIKED